MLLTHAGSGPKPSGWSASYDPASQSLKTRQLSLFSPTSTESLEKLPRSGMISGGMLYPLPPLVPDISANASSLSLPTLDTQPMRQNANANATKWDGHNSVGSFVQSKLLPTPIASQQKRGTAGPGYGKSLKEKLLPTPTTRDFKDSPGMSQTGPDDRDRTDQLPRRIYATASVPATGGMKLTPEFLCWLMGFPPDWLKPLAAALATPSSRKSPKSSPKP